MSMSHRRLASTSAFPLSISLGLAACLLAALPACKATLGPANEDDDVREENLELRNRVADLEEKLALRTAQIDSMRQARENRADAARSMPDAEPIVLTDLKLGDYTGLIDTDGDGTTDLARAYARPRNQRGRFTPVAGRAVLQVIGLTDTDAGGEPRTIAEQRYTPTDWDDAYRSGFTGTHYTLEAPLPVGSLDGLTGAVIRVVLIEAETGIRVEAQASRSLSR